MSAISLSRPRVVCDLRVEKTFFAHQVSHDLLEATQRLILKGPPQSQVSTVCPKPLLEFVPSGPRQVELFRANYLDACNNVVSFHWQAVNAAQFTMLLVTKDDRARQQYAS